MVVFILCFLKKPTREQEDFLANQNAYDIISMNIKRIYYDGIMLMALALNQSIEDLKHLIPPKRLEDFSYQDTKMVEVFNENVRHMEFTGISVSTYYVCHLSLCMPIFFLAFVAHSGCPSRLDGLPFYFLYTTMNLGFTQTGTNTVLDDIQIKKLK